MDGLGDQPDMALNPFVSTTTARPPIALGRSDSYVEDMALPTPPSPTFSGSLFPEEKTPTLIKDDTPLPLPGSSKRRKVSPSTVEEGAPPHFFFESARRGDESPTPELMLSRFVRSRGAATNVDPPESTGRFESDFKPVAVIGTGHFGRVVRCTSRIDGCDYAVKITKFRGRACRSSVLREVRKSTGYLCGRTPWKKSPY